ncbi:pyridoxamine 5'-phosphate oxidase family protein [Rhodococcus sp. JVH1]|uniref:pyridoxamine 5'-phosphate oxidase family protein n=1 Tax=Rhodococcus sp. JVH1 TaxID=745408 RepID=UPI000271F3F8|nr:pyridoxamine 5'-phosphate oxidase family protein [Rhodococcus sp. JVH1]EJI98543.1 pyridoxamine 5'-phosphate oxidase family protein [Rhodococcus sp. JVH1]
MSEIGSVGERQLQQRHGTADRAARFYADQVLDHLNLAMIEFVGRQEMTFVATADASGECDNSLRAGAPGFIHVIDSTTLAYPEYRGNGVMASLGNILENPHVGLILVDFVHDLIGLHVNGAARLVEDADLRSEVVGLPVGGSNGRTPECWVVVDVDEAYIHCRKHIPRMARVPHHRDWGTDDVKRKAGDYFDAKDTTRLDAQSVGAELTQPIKSGFSAVLDSRADSGGTMNPDTSSALT